MALPPATNDVFAREVDDELRRDRLLAFWRRWGKWLIAGLLGALVLFAAVLFGLGQRQAAAEAQGEQLTAAYDLIGQKDEAGAAPKLAALAASRRDGYRAMAIFAQADLLLTRGDAKGAAAKFAGIAADAGQPAALRDLALVRQTAIEFDGLKPGVVVERMRPLAVAGGAWLGSAGELLAAAYLAEGRADLAAGVWSQIAAGDEVPATLRARAVQMAGAAGAAPAAGARP